MKICRASWRSSRCRLLDAYRSFERYLNRSTASRGCDDVSLMAMPGLGYLCRDDLFGARLEEAGEARRARVHVLPRF